MFSLLPNRDNAWPDNMSPGRASLHNDSRYPANGKPELLLPLIAKDQHRRATRRYWLLVPVVLMVAAYPLLLRGLFGAVAILETLITAAVFSAGVFLWTFPGRKAAFDAWVACIVATIIAFGMVGSLMEPYLIGIVFFFVFLGLSDSVFVHGLAIRGAAPCDKKRRDRLFDIYRYRYSQISPRYPVHHFLIPLFAVTLAFTVWQWPWLTTPREYVGPELFALGVCAFVWYLPLHMHIGYQMSGQKPQFGVLDSYRAGLQTLHSWFTYNLAGASTPVGFQTPAGTAGRRMALFVAALIFISPIANPYFHQSIDFVRGEQLKAGRFLFPTELDRQREQDIAAEELFSGGRGLFNLLEPKKKHETVTVLDKQAIRFLGDHPERGRINEDGSLTIFYDNDFYRDYQASTPNGRVLSQEYRKAEADAVLARVDRARAEYARRMVTQGTLHAVLIGFIHFVLSFLPLLTLIGLLVSTIGRAQAELNSKGFALPLEQVYNTSNWRNLVARIRTSNDATERESLLWGICQEDGSPILVPRSALREHVHFLGSTGSGKTAIGLSPLVSQLMDFEDCSVVVIDLKGDDSLLMEELRCGQDRRHAPDDFFHFTSELGKGSYSFNLFKQSLWKTLSLNDKTDLLTTGLGLFHGTDYARKYYSDANFAIVEAALRLNPEVESFSELEQQIATALEKADERAEAEFLAAEAKAFEVLQQELNQKRLEESVARERERLDLEDKLRAKRHASEMNAMRMQVLDIDRQDRDSQISAEKSLAIAAADKALQDDMARVTSVLKPFISKAQTQVDANNQFVTLEEPAPVSWATIQGAQVLDMKNVDFWRHYIFKLEETGRDRGGAPMTPFDKVNINPAQLLLKKHGEAMVRAGLLAP